MPEIIIRIYDAEDGAVAMSANYVGGYNAQSHAHVIGNGVIGFLDAQAESKTDLSDSNEE